MRCVPGVGVGHPARARRASTAPPSAAACRSAARTRRAWASQNSRSPDPPRPVPVVTAPSMSAARSAAVTGSAQPVSGSNVIVDGSPASPVALNTYTGPRSARSGAVMLVEVGAGGGDEDGAGGVDDPPGQVLGLAGARAAEHHEDVLGGDPDAQQADPAQLQPDLRGGEREQLPPPGPPRAGR